MKINKLKLYNFQSYEKEELNDLNKVSITGIIGRYKNNINKSNGSGKSTLIDAILYALYGRGRCSTENELIRDNENEMSVFFEFNINNQNVSILRGRKNDKPLLELIIDNNQFSEGIRETQGKITKLVGMDFNLFVATVFFQQFENDSFTSSTPAIRKEYLKNILRLDFWDECYKITKNKTSELDTDLMNENSMLEALESNLENKNMENLKSDYDSKHEEYDGLKKKYDNDNNMLLKNKSNRDKLNSISEEIKYFESEYMDLEDSLKDYNSKLEDIKKSIEVLQNENSFPIITDKDNLKLKKEIKSYENKISDIVSLSSNIEANMSNIKENIRLIQDEQECPTCKQSINDEYKESLIDKSKEEYNNYKLKLEKSKNEKNRIEDKIKNLKNKYDENDNILRQIESVKSKKEYYEKDVKVYKKLKSEVNVKFEKIKASLNEKKEKLNDIKKELTIQNINEFEENLDSRKNKLEELREGISELKINIENYEKSIKKIDVVKKKIKELKEESSYYDVLKSIFSKNGIISDVIKTSIFEIEEESNRILNDIDNSGKRIIFETVKETKSSKQISDTLDIYIESQNNTRKYESFSGGEKTIINFAIRMALSHILSKREGIFFDLIVLDEVFASLDNYYRNKIMNVINYLKNEFKQIFVISHTEIQDVFPNLIEIEKDEITHISRVKNII